MTAPLQPEHERLAEGVAFVVYGTVAVLAAMGGLALESSALHAPEAAAVLIVVAVSAWLAHSLWRVVRVRAERRVAPERSHEVHELLRSWPILASGMPGTAVLVLTSLGHWSVASGLHVAQALGVAVLFGGGIATARLAGESGLRQLAYVVLLPAVGIVIVLLEVAAHKV